MDSTARDRALRAYVYAGLLAPLLVAAAAIAVQLVVIPDVPDPVAVHWTVGGPDGFGPAWSYPLMTALVGFLLPALLALSAVPSVRRGDSGPTFKLVAATSLGLSVLMSALATALLVSQRGLDDAADAPGAGWLVGLAFAAGIAAAGIAWIALPTLPYVRTQHELPDVALAAGERVAWMRTAGMRGGLVVLLGGVAVALGLAGLWMLVAGDPAAGGIMLGAGILIGALASMTTTFAVTADDRGLRVRAAAGWPTFEVPLDDMESVTAIEVSGLGQFGGYGLRSVPGAFGVILRAGEAIEVTRSSGRRFVVTVDDAATGAAVLDALVAQRSER